MVSVQYPEIKNEIKLIALKYLIEEGGTENIVRMMRHIHKTVEELISDAVPLSEKAVVACHRGCCSCCRVTVPVLLPEAVFIASYIKSNLNHDSLTKLIDRMEQLFRDIVAYDEEERIAANKPCAFLGDYGECIVHDVRPLACRAVISADSDACREAMKLHLFDEHVYVPMNMKHKSITDSAFVGLAEAMDEVGISSRSFEITSQVLKLLT